MNEIIEDDGSHTLTIGAVSDVEIRLTIVSSLARNEKVAGWDFSDQQELAEEWFTYVKEGVK